MSMELKSEISGSVWKIEVAKGDKVEKDDTLIIFESMKMEIPLSSPENGIVKEIKVNEGDSVVEDEIVMVIE